VRGKSGHVPFWPGGLDDLSAGLSNSKPINKGLRTVPPGFSRGLRLPGEISDGHELLAIDSDSPETLDEGEKAV
jgi:antiviral helicase SKI2